MSTDNADQIAEWNGVLGQTWATMRDDIDPVVAVFGDAALTVANVCWTSAAGAGRPRSRSHVSSAITAPSLA